MTQGIPYEVVEPLEYKERGDQLGARRKEDPPGARTIMGDVEKTQSPNKPSCLVSCFNP